MSILIHKAEDGTSFEVSITGDTVVESLKAALESVIGIAVKSQILLYKGMKLESQRTLEEYGLPLPPDPNQDLASVFLFDRGALRPDTAQPPPTILEIPQVTLGDLPQSAMSPSAMETQPEHSPLRTIVQYEAQFQMDVMKAKGYLEKFEQCLGISRNCLDEQAVQRQAFEAAYRNLTGHSNQVTTFFEKFLTQYNNRYVKHGDLLKNFDTDLSKLKDTPLHNTLQSQHRKTLLDCVPKQDLESWSSKCRELYNHLNEKVPDLQNVYNDIMTSFESGVSLTPTSPQLLENVDAIQKCMDQATTVVEIMVADSEKIRRILMSEETLRLGASALNDECVALESQNDVHQKVHMVTLADLDKTVTATVEACAQAKTQLSCEIHKKLLVVSLAESKIRDLSGDMMLYQDVMKREKHAFTDLGHLSQMPDAYWQGLREVVRRRNYRKTYMVQAGEVAENISKEREAEVARRERFHKRYGKHLPKNLIPGLAEKPPYFEINFPSFDADLPPIDSLDDMEADMPALSEADDMSVASSSMMTSRGGSLLVAAAPSADSQGLSEMNHKVQQMDAENKKLHVELNSATAAMERLRIDLEVAQASTGKAQEVEASLMSLRDECKLYVARIAELQGQVDAHNTAAANLRADLMTSKEIITATTRERDSVEAKLKEVGEALSGAKAALGDAHTEKAECETKIESLAEQIADLKEQLQTTNESLKLETDKNVTLSEDIARKEKMVADSQDAVNQHEVLLRDQRDRALAEVETTKLQLKTQLSEHKSLKKRYKQLMERNNVLETSLAKFREDIVAEARRRDDEMKEVARTQAAYGMEISELKLKNERKDNEIAKLKSELESSSNAKMKLRTDVTQAVLPILRSNDIVVSDAIVSSADVESMIAALTAGLPTSNDSREATAEVARLLQQLETKDLEMNELRQRWRLTVSELRRLQAANADAMHTHTNAGNTSTTAGDVSSAGQNRHIATSQFAVNDQALFIRNYQGHYVAFNQNFPYFFLAPDALQSITVTHSDELADYVVGTIIHIQENVATSEAQFDLAPGTRYAVCTIFPTPA
eukprot:GFYU01002924.1.p1 GENE.GFYU01002924.1~~GFYU01002924.1.p1  ORF type:complete len:1060 (-),score=318.65 GFYU01002924.1:109-3288(-)